MRWRGSFVFSQVQCERKDDKSFEEGGGSIWNLLSEFMHRFG